MRISHACVAFTVALTSGVLAMGAAEAQIVDADVGKNIEYQQTGPATVTFVGAFFAARTFFNAPSDFDGGYVAFSGPASPQTFNIAGSIDCCGGTREGLGYQTGYMTLPALDTAYPTGIDYALTATNSGTSASQTVMVGYAQDLYTTDIPALSAASFTALQGANPSAGLTLTFDSFTPNPDATVSQGFFTIYDTTTGQVAFTDNGFSPTTTSVSLNSGTLTAGDQYDYELIFDDQVTGPSGAVATDYYSDVRTSGVFSTAVPEPAGWVLMTLGVAATGGLSRRSRRRLRHP